MAATMFEKARCSLSVRQVPGTCLGSGSDARIAMFPRLRRVFNRAASFFTLQRMVDVPPVLWFSSGVKFRPRSKMRRAVAATLAFGQLNLAHAQAWLSEPRRAEGAGIRVGRLVLHPGVAGEFGYDSNLFLRSSTPGTENGEPSLPRRELLIFRVTPHVSAASVDRDGELLRDDAPSASPPTLAFRLNAMASYREFLGVEPDSSFKPRVLSGEVDGRVELFPQRPITLAAAAGYTHAKSPNALGIQALAFDVDAVRAGLDVKARYGTFEASIGYGFLATFFDSVPTTPFSNWQHALSVRNQWRFRPQTSLFHETVQNVTLFRTPDRAVNNLADSRPLRTRLGLNGLVTPRVGVLLAAGYGASFHDRAKATAQYDGVIGQAEFRTRLTRSTMQEGSSGSSAALQVDLSGGYVRDFENNYLGTYTATDKGYATVSTVLFGRLWFRVQGSLAWLRYPGATLQGGVFASPAFDVRRGEVSAFGEYRFGDSFAVNVTAQYLQNASDAKIRYDAARVFGIGFARTQLFLGARFFL
jgi:hypothetical protein